MNKKTNKQAEAKNNQLGTEKQTAIKQKQENWVFTDSKLENWVLTMWSFNSLLSSV